MSTWQVFKYPIHTVDTSIVQMPLDARIMHVGLQGHTICLWAEVRQDAVAHDRTFHVIGTGPVVPEQGNYLGTVMDGHIGTGPVVPEQGNYLGTVMDGHFVWHVYET